MYLIRFLPNFAVFCVFLWISRLCDGAKYQWAASFTYTNWRLKICIWRLYFSSWSPKGDLRIFLILSPVVASIHNSGVSPRQELTVYEMTFNEICLPSSHMYKFNEYLVTKILCTLLDTRRALDTRKWDMKMTFYVTSKTLWQMWTDA